MSKVKDVIVSIACALLIPGLTGQSSIRAQSGDVERALDRAVQLHQAGDVSGAITQYRAILALHPGRMDVRSNLGAAYAQLGRFEEAIAEYKQALANDSLNAGIRLNLGLAFYKAAYFSEALSEFEHVVAAQPENTRAILLLADCHLRLGENKKVIALLSPLEAKLGDDRLLAYVLGTALINDKQVEKGQVLIDRIFRDGDTAEVRVMMGTAQMMTGNYQAALKEFERALEMNPRLPTLHALYGRALMPVGDTEQASQAFRRELEINPNDFESNLFLGILLRKEAKEDEALGYLRRAAQLRPNDLNARYHIAAVQLASGKITEAQRSLEAIVKTAPEFVEAHVLLANAYYRLNRKADGDQQRSIIQKLDAERQERQPGAQEGIGDAYGGVKSPQLQDIPKKP
ncbi:MAG TPA: tetratricopeptide repeat protein [Blastocatellia bacterium]|jgi:tetratricopeptide (TPR) repeat protein|nr:tetratricopeptide repeat protein [Blastocatellia bacterium]